MSTTDMPDDVVEYEYTENPVLANGEWHWRVIDNQRHPVVKCPTCGGESYFPERYTVASDGLLASPKGKGFYCRNRPECSVKGRWLLKDFAAHSRLPE